MPIAGQLSEVPGTQSGQLGKHEVSTKCGEFVTLPSAGLELRDVVKVTHDRRGVPLELFRVRGIEETYDAAKHPLIYRQKAMLGGPSRAARATSFLGDAANAHDGGGT
jgi:hypothetical protein